MRTKMSDPITLAGALALGLLGSTHCVGMCGGISAALGMADPQRERWFGVCYNLGRIGSYAALGALVSAMTALLQLGLQPWLPYLGAGLRTLAGALVIGMGLYVSGWWLGLRRLEQLGGGLWRRVQPFAQTWLPPRSTAGALALGAAWGLLPCGLVYSSLGWAALAADPLHGAALMAAFGAGTVPAIMLTGSGAQTLRKYLQRISVRRVAGALLIAFGLATAVLPWQHIAHGAHKHANTFTPVAAQFLNCH
jgi:uncharacterized protein